MPRSGFLTPSTFSDLMSNGKGKDTMGATALRIVNNLAMDMLGVERSESREMKTPASCQWGLDHEWEAIQEYQDRTFREVLCPVEFRVSPTHTYVGGTMDGLIGSKGGIEVKCPFDSLEHLYNLQEAKQLYRQYMHQVQGYFWIFELEWVDFLSYDPRFPEPNNLYIHRVGRDEDHINRLKARCEMAYEKAIEIAYSLGGDTG